MKLLGKYSIVVLLILTAINILYTIKAKERFNSRLEPQSHENHLSIERSAAQWREIVLNENAILSNSLLYSGIDTANTIYLSELATSRRLILSFTGGMCTPCIKYSVDKLKEHFPNEFQSEKILFICSDIEERFNIGYYDKSVYSPVNGYSLPINVKVPTYYILDSDFIAELFFLPDDMVPKLTDAYLSAIKERFFK